MSRGIPVGIDVEQCRPNIDPLFITPFFHLSEQQALVGCSIAALIRCWARKEAVMKTTGQGMGLPLTGFCVAVDDCDQDWLLDGPPSRSGAWTCVDLPIRLGYHLSVVAAAPAVSVQAHRVAFDQLTGGRPWPDAESMSR